MSTDALTVLGAGGHACVVIDAWMQAGGAIGNIAVWDENPQLNGQPLDRGIRITAPVDWSQLTGRPCHVAIGDNEARGRLLRQVRERGGRPCSVVHPQATVAGSARVEEGAFIAAQAIVSARAVVGAGAIINHGAIVDHDCTVGASAHIGPNSTLGGRATVGERVLVGAGAVVLPGIAIGDDAVVGAGAVVNRVVVSGRVVVGVPAKEIPSHD